MEAYIFDLNEVRRAKFKLTLERHFERYVNEDDHEEVEVANVGDLMPADGKHSC